MKKRIKDDLYYLQWLAEQTKNMKLHRVRKEIQEYCEKKTKDNASLLRRNKDKLEKIYTYEDGINDLIDLFGNYDILNPKIREKIVGILERLK